MTESNVIEITFEDVVEGEDWEIPCDCLWHDRHPDAPAEWVVRRREFCDCRPPIRLHCDPCLQEILASEALLLRCPTCGERKLARPRDLIVSVEPIRKDAA